MTQDVFKNIVVGVDISSVDRLVSNTDPRPRSLVALACAKRIALRNHAHLHVLTNLEVDLHAEAMIQRDHDAGRGSVLDAAKKYVEALVEPIRAEGVTVTTAVAFGHPSIALLRDARDHARDLIVVGTRERGAVARNVLGSVSLRLVRKARPPVFVARKGPHEDWNNILCPVDFSELSPKLLSLAADAARTLETKLHVAHVVDYSGERVMAMGGPVPQDLLQAYRDERRTSAQASLDKLVAENVPADVDVEVSLLDGRPADAILEKATEIEADLVVMGSVAHSALRGMLSGSTAEGVLPHIETSLLVLKPESFAWQLVD